MLTFKIKSADNKKACKFPSLQRVSKSIPPAVFYQFLVDIVGCVKDRFYLGLYCSNIMTFIHFHYRFIKLSQSEIFYTIFFHIINYTHFFL